MALALAFAVAFGFGAADQYLGSLITLGPWVVSISLMSAPWLVLPFVFGCRQNSARRAAVVGLAATACGLLGYFVMTLSPIEGVSLSNVDPLSFVRSQDRNIVGGLVTGPLFGFLGYRWREQRWWVSAALVAGALCFEPVVRIAVGRLDPPGAVWTFEVVTGVLLAGHFVTAGITHRRTRSSSDTDHQLPLARALRGRRR